MSHEDRARIGTDIGLRGGDFSSLDDIAQVTEKQRTVLGEASWCFVRKDDGLRSPIGDDNAAFVEAALRKLRG